MRKLSRWLPDQSYWSIAMAGIILYNAWLLAFFLNFHATAAGATTSELGIAGQPYYWLFRLTDIASGVCFLLTAGAMSRIVTGQKTRLVMTILWMLLGVSTILESLVYPLTCSSALSQSCAQLEATSSLSLTHQFHMIESMASYASICLVPFLVIISLHGKQRSRRLYGISLALFIFMIFWATESFYRIAHHARNFGYEQRLFILVFSYWYYQVITHARQFSRANQALTEDDTPSASVS